MAKSRRNIVFERLAALEKRLEEQTNFARYEYMERPEIAPYAKGSATAYHTAALMVNLCRQELEESWPEKKQI